MFRLVKPTLFFETLSASPRLKFILAWSSFGGIVLPSAFLLSLGVPEKYVLPSIFFAVLPFQYLVFCLFDSLNSEVEVEQKTTNPLLPAALMHGLGHTSIIDCASGPIADQIRQQSEMDHIELVSCIIQVPAGSGKSHLVAHLLGLEAAEAKHRDEMIKRQRKALEAPANVFSLGTLRNLPQIG